MKTLKLLISEFKMKRTAFCFISLFIFNFSFTNAQPWNWAKQGLSNSGGEGMAVATDKQGNSFLSGNFYDSLHFGANNLYTAGGDVFLAKYDASGNALWALQSANGYGAFPYSLATDDSGNVFMTGTIYNNITFGTVTLTGSGIFLVKYDPNGNFKWARREVYTNGYSLSVDAWGYSYIAGQSYFSKYDPNGLLLINTVFNSRVLCYGVSAIPGTKTKAAEYITGYFSGQVIFGNDTLNCTSSSDNIFTVKYDSVGNVLWARQSETQDFMYSYMSNGGWCSVAADINGNAYITGFYNSSISFGNDTLPSGFDLYQPNMYVAKYDSGGNLKWASYVTSTDSSVVGGYSIAADSNNDIYITGSCTPNKINTTSVAYRNDTFTMLNPGDVAIFLECDSSGTPLCGGLIRTGGDDNNSVACDITGKYVYLGGDAEFQTILGNDTVGFGADSIELPFVAQWENCVKEVTGINEVKGKSEKVKVYPNPFTNYTTISIINNSQVTSGNYLELDDITGRKLKYIEFKGDEYELSAEGLSKGLYFIRVFDNENNVVGIKKVIVQ